MTKQTAKPAKAQSVDGVPDAGLPSFHISPDRMKLAEQVRHAWQCVVPAGTQLADLDLKTEPFALVAHLLSMGDDVRCVTADGRSIIDCICVMRSGARALCRVTQIVNVPAFTEQDMDRVPDGFSIVEAKPGDEQSGWLVTRVADGVVINAGHFCYDREAAVRFLLDHASVRVAHAGQGPYRGGVST